MHKEAEVEFIWKVTGVAATSSPGHWEQPFGGDTKLRGWLCHEPHSRAATRCPAMFGGPHTLVPSPYSANTFHEFLA